MRKVDCLIISTGRAASTAVYQYLSEMAAVGLPTNKEPHFWCDLDKFEGRYPMLDELRVTSDEAYERLYSGSKSMIDASVGYFFCIDDVLQKLGSRGQAPKVVFLYREPAARAASLFVELRKKGLEQAGSVVEAVRAAHGRPTGLWWERYYDNVLYATVFKEILGFAESVLAVNYDAFAAAPGVAMARILEFVGLPMTTTIQYVPVNSSSEARFTMATARVGVVKRLLPRPIKQIVRTSAVRLLRSWSNLSRANDLSSLLPLSMSQYRELQNIVEHREFFDSRDH